MLTHGTVGTSGLTTSHHGRVAFPIPMPSGRGDVACNAFPELSRQPATLAQQGLHIRPTNTGFGQGAGGDDDGKRCHAKRPLPLRHWASLKGRGRACDR